MTTAIVEKVTRPAIASEREKLGFKELKGSTGATLHVAQTQANYWNSKATLEKAGLEFFTRQEILLILTKDETLKESLKGKWFYIGGEGLNMPLSLYTIDEKGELVERKGTVSPEMTVRVWNGQNPLYLGVLSDVSTAQYGRRFYLGAYYVPYVVAPVVVGKAKQKQEGREAAAPQNGFGIKGVSTQQFNVLLRQADTSVNELSGNVDEKVLEPIKQLIRAIKIKG